MSDYRSICSQIIKTFKKIIVAQKQRNTKIKGKKYVLLTLIN